MNFIIATLFAVMFVASASAAQIDFSAPILGAEDKPIHDCTEPNCTGPVLKLGDVASRALSATFEDERALAGDEKFKRGDLALKVGKGGMHDLTVEDIALIKKVIAKGYGPLIVIRAWTMLDPAAQHGRPQPPISPNSPRPTLKPGQR